MVFKFPPNIAVIGLGYVGLPLAVALAKHFNVVGLDINKTRIEELKSGFDRTHEISAEILHSTSLSFYDNPEQIRGSDVFIVTVPTPVREDNLPDLNPLESASQTVGSLIQKNAIVVYESTVYPGVTEDFCGPILEKISGLKAGTDFYLGYSPERINPGDKEHTIDRITKVVSGQNDEVALHLRKIYGAINQDNIFVAKTIKTAEAAKVIENAQRDINIAFINEIATIAVKLNLSIHDILEAANTKWNFIKFQPGLVGGHCIGVDPYYLAHCARMLDHEPEVILAGRRINEGMGNFIAQSIHQVLLNHKDLVEMNRNLDPLMHPSLPTHPDPLQAISQDAITHPKPMRILILGLTFKENIPDLRNTKVIDVVNSLKKLGHEVDVHDSMACAKDAHSHFGIPLITSLETAKDYDCVIGAVPHRDYIEMSIERLNQLLKPGGLLADIKNMWRHHSIPKGTRYWSL